MQSKFAHLHLHSKYSLLDGMCKFEELAPALAKLNMHTVALTDHGNMYGAVEFYSQIAKAGIKPIIGIETYVVEDVKDNKREKGHLVLLVKNEEGYKNLIKISSFAFTDGFYYKPSVDKKFLKEHSAGLIALSSCVMGEVPSKIINSDPEGARDAAKWYLETFGEGNYYLEIQNHGMEEQLIACRGLKEISKELSIPLVASNDCHYISRDDAKAHEILMYIQTGKTVKDGSSLDMDSSEYYLKSEAEMKSVFPDDHAAVELSLDIANKCVFELQINKKLYMPKYICGDSTGPEPDYDAELVKLAGGNLLKVYPEITPEIQARFDSETATIKKLGYSGYFLIVHDIINFARSQNIPVGPGRGSAAGSLIAYALGITGIDPLKYGLLFERFLNPDRISPPDIDIDFSDEERDKVISYITGKFGRDKTAQIVTFQTLKPRQAIRDVGRALDIELKAVDALSKKVPEVLNIEFKDILKNPEFLHFMGSDPVFEEIVNYAVKIEGLLRQDSTHAAGVVIAPEPLTNLIPIAVPKDKESSAPETMTYMTQYPMESLEKVGLLKFDILGLRNLSVIKRCLEMIKESTGAEPAVLSDKEYMDPEVYKMLSDGDTQGVFQLESTGMRDILKKIQPTKFEEIVAIISLFRPGPMKMIDDYIKRKKGLAEIKNDFKELDIILAETYGIAVYQEQVMQIAVAVAGFTVAEADNLRRAMSKKKEKEMEKIKVHFLKGAAEKNYSAEKAGDLFDKLEQFSSYGFNKSHAAAYAVVTYQTAWLKAHYPGYYTAALLTSVMDKQEKMAGYAEDYRRSGGKVLLPDVNESLPSFAYEKNMIRFGLAAVKNVGVLAAGEIVRARKEKGRFKSLDDFCEKVTLKSVNSKTIESLVKAGAFDFTLMTRAQLFESVESAMKNGEIFQRNAAAGQFSLFGEEQPREIPKVPEWSETHTLTAEREVLGLYLSSHPLAKYEKLLSSVAVPIRDILEGSYAGPQVMTGGVITGLKKKVTPDRGEKASFILEDLTGGIQVFANEKVTREKEGLLSDKMMFMIRGRINFFDDKPVIYLDSLISLEDAYEKLGKYVHINLREIGLEEMTMREINSVLAAHKGTSPVILHVYSKDGKKFEMELAESMNVKITEELLAQLQLVAGEQNIKISWKK